MSNFNSDSSTGGSESFKQFQLTTDVEAKKSPEFGIKIAHYVRDTVKGGWGNYYWLRNERYRINRDWANGRTNVEAMFRDYLDMNGKVNYSNLMWESIKIVNTAIGRIVGGWMGRHEKIEVTAIDPVSVNQKNDQAVAAEFYLENKEDLAEMQDASGVQMIPKSQFVAEDRDALDEWCILGNRLPEEIKYELGVNTIFDQNGLYDVIKEKLLHDSAETGFVGTLTEMDGEGQVKVIQIMPENAVYSYSEFPDFRDTTIRGHIFSMKISECRAKYPRLTEQQIWKLAQTSKEYKLQDKITQWTVAYDSMMFRPYDEWNFDCLQFELKSFDKTYYTAETTRKNKSTIIKKGVDATIKDNQEVVADQKWNIYKGVFAMDADMMLEWGLKKNMVRPQDPKEIGNVEFSYSFFMPQAYKMRNVAIPEKIEVPVKMMMLILLKIQQCIAKCKPPGAKINADAMQELELGLAGGATTASEAQRIYNQTGDLYYRGRDAEGNVIPVPIEELANVGFAPQMQALTQQWQFQYSMLANELGSDPNLMQQAAKPRVTEGNIQTANQLSDNATDHFYDAYLYVCEETSKKVACLLNMSVTFGAKAYRDLMKQDEVKGRNFQTKAQMLPNELEIQRLDAMMQNAITANPTLAQYLDQFRIMRIAKENLKLGELIYSNSLKRALKTEQQIALQNSQQNAQINEATQQAKEQGDAQLQAAKDLSAEKLVMIGGAFELLKAGVPLPENMQAVMYGIIENVSLPLMLQNEEMKQAAAQAQQPQQQSEGQMPNQQQQQLSA